MSKQADLQAAIAYLIDLDAELDERSTATPHANSAARADISSEIRIRSGLFTEQLWRGEGVRVKDRPARSSARPRLPGRLGHLIAQLENPAGQDP